MIALATLILFGLGFVVLPFGTSWHEIPKVTVALLVIAIFAGVTLYKKGISKHPAYLLYGGFFLLSLYGLTMKWTPTIFFGNAFRMQGILSLWALLLWSLTSAMYADHPKRKIIEWVSLLVTLIFAIYGRTDVAGRAVGTVGEANSLGAFSVFLLPLTQSVFAVIPTLIVIVLSGSRSALIGFLAGMSIWITSKRFSALAGVTIATLILVFSLALPFFDTQQTNDYRADVWRTAIEAGREKPILGWGVGNTEVGLRAAADVVQTFPRYQYVDSSHNVFLDWWVQGGIIGLTLFTLTLVFAIYGLLRQKEVTLLASLYGILAVMLFNPVSISILVPFWWIVGKGLTTKFTVATVLAARKKNLL